MANSKDDAFIGDLEECLRLAEELEKVDTEDTKLFVSQQLQKLHTFLQTKQIETEGRIEEQIRKEEHEIEDLKDRIARVSQGTGDESDLDYANFEELWHVLKEDYWRAAFYAYIAETTEPAEAIIYLLLALLKDLVSMCKKCQKRSTPFCLPSIQQAIVRELKEDRAILKQFKTPQKPLLRALEMFAEKCVEFCWIACFEEPEILLVTVPMKECKALAGRFMELERTKYKNRENAAIVEWPAIVQGENIRIQWQLFSIHQARPQPDKRRLPDNDYRVIRFEDNQGRELDGSDWEEGQKYQHEKNTIVHSADEDMATKMAPTAQVQDSSSTSMANVPRNDKTNTKTESSKTKQAQEKGKGSEDQGRKPDHRNTEYTDSKKTIQQAD